MELAVDRCIDENVLRDFLIEHRKEARGMLKDITLEEFLDIRGAEEREEGRAEGRAEEQERIAKNLLVAGVEIETIAVSTGLTEDMVLRLKENA